MKLNIAPNDIIMLYDSTIFGGGGDGLIITKDNIIGKIIFNERDEIFKNLLHNIEIRKNSLYINWVEFCDLTWIEKDERTDFINTIKSIAHNKEYLSKNKPSTIMEKDSNAKVQDRSLSKIIVQQNYFFKKGCDLDESSSPDEYRFYEILSSILENKKHFSPAIFAKPHLFLSEEDCIKVNIALNYLLLSATITQYFIDKLSTEEFIKLIDDAFIFEVLLFLNYRGIMDINFIIEQSELKNNLISIVSKEALFPLLVEPYIKRLLKREINEGFKVFTGNAAEREIQLEIGLRQKLYMAERSSRQ